MSTVAATTIAAEAPHRDVLVVGSVNADIVVELERLPVRGETIGTSKPDTGKFVPGGKGANQAAAAARLLADNQNSSLRATFVCQFGNDNHGAALERALQDAGVDITLAGHPQCASGQAFVFVYPDGENSIVLVGGANMAWPSVLPQAVVNAVQRSAIVLLQCEIPAEINYLVAKAAAAANVPVLYDSGGEDRAIPDDMLPLITYLCPNETELSRLAGRDVNTVGDAIEAARLLQARGANALLVTLGSQGSVFVPRAGDASAPSTIYQACFHAEQVVDTTGAGDCFRGAFAVAIAEGKRVGPSMRFAAAASALCVQVAGAMPSMPSSTAVVALMATE